MAVFLVVLVFVSAFFVSTDYFGFSEKSKTALWAALIVLFLIFFIVAISLFVNYLRDKNRGN